MSLLESGEMYLETIYILGKKNPYVRSVDISEEMGYSKPSVSRGISRLKADGYVLVEDSGHITLTDSGLRVAQTIYERHTILSRVLELLGVDPQVAAEDACRIEHVISPESFDAIKHHVKKYIQKPDK